MPTTTVRAPSTPMGSRVVVPGVMASRWTLAHHRRHQGCPHIRLSGCDRGREGMESFRH